MAEVLGTISAALQVAELGGRLSVKLCTFAHKYKNADKALRSLSNDVALTCSVLRQLGDSLRQDDLVSLYSPDAFATAQDVLEECKKVFKDLENEIEQQHPDPSSTKSRMERATRKIWFLMNEPRLDAVAGNLERLKSTMLLMLNVVIYAGQLRSRHEVNEAQEQRELLQMLAVEKIESEKKFQQLTTSIQFFNLNVQTNGNEPSSRLNESSQTNDELQHYYNMIKAVLTSIDTAERFLDEKRYHRLKTGFTTLHNMEAHRLREIYGSRASDLFSQLQITPVRNEPVAIPQQPMTQCPPPQAAQVNSAKKKKKRRLVSNDQPVRGKPFPEPAPTNSFNSELPKTVPQPSLNGFNDLRVPSDQSTQYLDSTAFNLDFSALDNPEILENFDFDTFLNTDGDQGFGFDPNFESNDTIDASLQPPLKRKQDAYGDLGGSPTVEGTSPENPDLWVLRWTTLKKAELHH